MRADWTGNAAGWVRHEAVFDAVFTPITAALLAAAALGEGQRVLDVGCGSGTVLAAAVAAGAEAVGIDIVPDMVEAARRRVPQATVVVGDAQTADLRTAAPGAPYDRVVSRFGVMFFGDPAAAFANIRHATTPGARLTFVCWRAEGENPMFTLGTSLLEERLDPPRDRSPDAPGPMAFADRDRLLGLLSRAGWESIVVGPLDVELDYAIDGSDGVEERLTMILSTSSGRMAQQELEPRLGPDGWRSLLDEVRAELRRHLVGGAVRFPGATWLVSATNG